MLMCSLFTKMLFYLNHKIHIGVDGAIDMICSSHRKWSYWEIRTRRNVDIGFSWCVGFCLWLCYAINPLTIGDDVVALGLVDEVNALAFGDSNFLLNEIA